MSEALAKGHSVSEVAGRTASRYGIAPSCAHRDVISVLNQC